MTPDPDPLARYSLLARAAAGRPLAVVSLREGLAFTDGVSLYIPSLPEIRFQTCLLAHSGLFAVRSFDPRIMTRIAGRRALAGRYLVLEAQRAIRAIGETVPIRVIDEIARLFAGPVSASAAESFARAADRHAKIPEAPPWLGMIKPLTMLRDRPSRTAAGGGTPGQPAPDEVDQPDLAERSRTLELLSMPVPRLSPVVKKLFGMGAAPSGRDTENGSGGTELRTSGVRSSTIGRSTSHPTTKVGTHGVGQAISGSHRYPEWDLHRGRYRPQWCMVTEIDPPDGPIGEPTQPTADQPLRRELARLGLVHERHRAQPRGDALDVTALVDHMVDRSHGGDGDPRVYETRRPTAHDLGVLVLLDVTGSTADGAHGHRIFDQQREVATRLTAALEELGDRVALYGFYSQGRDAVRYIRIKDFDDRYDGVCQRRLASLSPGGFTRLGAAIRHGIHILLTRGGTSKLMLVVIGDGRPYENGYEGGHAESDSRRALREGVGSGVGCVGLNVGAHLDDAISERVWGEFAHRHLDDPSSLAQHVRPLFRTALRDAGASKRTIDRDSQPRRA